MPVPYFHVCNDMNYEDLCRQIVAEVASRSYVVEVQEEKEVELEYRGPEEDQLPLFDEEYQTILLHRDVHFGQNFDVMLEYYARDEAPGIQEDIEIRKIKELMALEKKLGKNIAPYLLGGAEMERIAFFRGLYRQFETLLSLSPEGSTERLIAEFFLSDGEWESVLQKIDSSSIQKVHLLKEILLDDIWFDPLSPGFGMVPKAIVRIFGQRPSSESVRTLFSILEQGSFEFEEEVLSALRKIGDLARDFCIERFVSSQDVREKEKALIVLSRFVPDKKVQECVLTWLEKEPHPNNRLKEYALSLLEELCPDLIERANRMCINRPT